MQSLHTYTWPEYVVNENANSGLKYELEYLIAYLTSVDKVHILNNFTTAHSKYVGMDGQKNLLVFIVNCTGMFRMKVMLWSAQN